MNLNAVNQPTGVDQGSVVLHEIVVSENLQSQNSFSRWDYIIDDISESLNITGEHDAMSCNHDVKKSAIDGQSYGGEEFFFITDTSPSWFYADEEMKVFHLTAQINMFEST